MKLALLASFLLAACSVSAAPPGQHVLYRVGFAPGSSEGALQALVDSYRARLGTHAEDATFRVDAVQAAITAEFSFDDAFREQDPERTLPRPLDAQSHEVELEGEAARPDSCLARIDAEWVRFEGKECARGFLGSKAAAHAAGAAVHVYTDEFVRAMLDLPGRFEFLIPATDAFLKAHDTSAEREFERFSAWRKQHPGASPSEFDTLVREQGGPLPLTLWRRHRGAAKDDLGSSRLLVRSAELRERFANVDLAEVGFARDSFGYPAVSFALAKPRAEDFARWTESLIGQGLAVVLDDEVLVLATVRSRLPGSGIIEGGSGGFSMQEVQALVRLLRQPHLPLAPRSLATEFSP